jgi:hypothetical protein
MGVAAVLGRQALPSRIPLEQGDAVVSLRAWTPGVLVALAVGATGYTYLIDRSAVSDADRAERQHDVFPSFRVGDVRRVEIIRDGADVVLERAADRVERWTVSSRLRRGDHAEGGAVDALLRELELAKRVREVPDGEAHGLEEPRVHGSLRVGRIDYEFALGADAPRPDGAAYMRVDGEGAFVIDRALKVQLLRGADDYRDRAMVPYGAGELARIEIATPTNRFALERAGSTFRLQSATGLRADRVAVDRIFAALADARADAFLDDAAADRALATPPWTVRVIPRDVHNGPVDLALGGACPGQGGIVAIARQETSRVSACVPGAVIEGIDTKPDALVDHDLFYAHADEIEELRLEPAPELRIDLARRGAGWHERSPTDRDLDSEESDAANDLASDIAQARASEARAGSAGEHVAAHARVSITRTGGGAGEALEIDAAGPDGSALARRIDDGAVLRLSSDVVRRVEARAYVLRSRAVWAAPFDAAAIVAVETTCGAARQRLELRNGRWLLRAPPGFEADAADADALADALAHTQANRWIAERDDGAFGLEAADACSVTAQLAPGPEGRGPRTVGVVFGRETEGGIYAKTLDAPGVFIASGTLRALASCPAIDRDQLRVDPRTVTRMTLVRGAAHVTLERHGVHWVRADGGVGADERLADGALEVAAQEALHPGPPARSEGFGRPTLEIEAFTGGDGTSPSTTDIVVGAPTRVGTTDAYFARVSGINATFAIGRPGIDAILGAW